jgi:GNAT superfamily N-acetyltransferase
MREGFPPVALSDIDEERFGIKTAKTPLLTSEDLPGIMEFCVHHHVELLIARCPAHDMRTVQDMEELGFSLMDSLVYYSCNLNRNAVHLENKDFVIREFAPGEEQAVKTMAEESFRGYPGHYHADRRLDKKKCDEIYPDWAFKSCISRAVADVVLIAECHGAPAGFATMRTRNESEGEGVLFGVSPLYQGQGVYRLLMIGGMMWCVRKGFGTMLVSTQVTNFAVQKVWVRLGFEPSNVFYTFHKWFDPQKSGGQEEP